MRRGLVHGVALIITILSLAKDGFSLTARGRDSLRKVTTEVNDTIVAAEASIEEINEADGIAEYLFQGDINLTEEQLGWLEGNVDPKKSETRQKRQVDRGARRWANNRLFYFFDSSVSARMRGIVKDALQFIRDRTCIEFTESSTALNRVKVFSGVGCFATIGMAGGEQSLSLGSGCEAVSFAHETEFE
nr:Peptidase M12A domain containing protein [Haemonchus contortus]